MGILLTKDAVVTFSTGGATPCGCFVSTCTVKLMNNRKRPQGSEDPLFEMAPGVYVKRSPFTNHMVLGGVEVDLEVGWVDGLPVIDRLTFTRLPGGTIHPSILRSVSLPKLLSGATSDRVQLFADPEGTIPFDESRQEGESLEQWAARLAYAAVSMKVSPAEYIADVQGIEVSTAHQRIFMCRKMGLIGPATKEGA